MLGIPRRELCAMPMGELCDLIACWQIAQGAKERPVRPLDEDMIPDLP